MAKTTVQSEISGTVIRIEAEEGTWLDVEDPILFLESMKMEIPITAPYAGTVLELLVEEGDVLEEGDEVAIIES